MPSYFQTSEPPIICYKYNKLIINTISNFNKLFLSAETVKIQNLIFAIAGHVLTGNLKIISDSRIRHIVSKGKKYRLPSYIDFKKCREEIASALNDFGDRWCKREFVVPYALKARKESIIKIVDKRIKFYSQKHTSLLPLNLNMFFDI